MPDEPKPQEPAAPERTPTFAEMTAQKVQEQFSDEVTDASEFRGDWTITVKKGRIVEILAFLRDDPALDYRFLADVTAVDYAGYLGSDPPARFGVIYNLCSYLQSAHEGYLKTAHRGRVRVKALVPEREAVIASAVPVWKGALWPEREVYDMFGIRFEGHPDLRRILMPVNFKDFPLRKDYPLKGKGERDVIAPEDPGFVNIEDVIKLRGSHA